MFWAIIEPHQRGVRTICGRNPTELLPGIHFFWPIVTRVELVPVVEQVLDTRPQQLTSNDGKAFAVGLSVAYEVLNVVKALYENLDYDANLAAEILRIAGEYVAHRSAAELADHDALVTWVTAELRKVATVRWGLKILRIGVTDFAEARTIRLMGVGNAPLTGAVV